MNTPAPRTRLVAAVIALAVTAGLIATPTATAQPLEIPDRITIDITDGSDCVVTTLDDCVTAWDCPPVVIDELVAAEGAVTYNSRVLIAGLCSLTPAPGPTPIIIIQPPATPDAPPIGFTG